MTEKDFDKILILDFEIHWCLDSIIRPGLAKAGVDISSTDKVRQAILNNMAKLRKYFYVTGREKEYDYRTLSSAYAHTPYELIPYDDACLSYYVQALAKVCL